MSLVGLDLNAARARAVIGPAGTPPRALSLEGARGELPLALSLQGRRIEVGQAGLALCRQLPHQVCHNFLAHLDTPREWAAGKHRLDAGKALALIFDRLRQACSGSTALALALPPYLSRTQRAMLARLAGQAKLPIKGTVTTPLAAAWTAYADRPWSGPALFVDADDHALMGAVLAAGDGQLQSLGETTVPQLGQGVWKARLLDAISDRCIRHSRRDPRETGMAEQMLFDQLDNLQDAALNEQLVEVVIRGNQWCQNLILRPLDIASFCAPQTRKLAGELVAFAAAFPAPRAVLVTAAAARLPGLVATVRDTMGERMPLLLLTPDAAAQAAHYLAVCFHKGEQPPGHVEGAMPLPKTVGKTTVKPQLKRVAPDPEPDFPDPEDDFSIAVED